jgi:lipopolysaccharide export system protein LptC
MQNRYAIIYPFVLAILFALVTFWINQTVQEQGPKLDGSNRHDPDYVMHNFLTTKTDVNGDVMNVLASKEMLHYPDDNTTVLQNPLYTQFRTDKPYTKIQGLRAYVTGNGDTVEFVDEVKVVRQATAGKGEMQLTTERLLIDPNKEMVTTDAKVMIKQLPKTVVTGEGLVFDNKNQTYTLKRNVHVHYEKPKVSIQKSK